MTITTDETTEVVAPDVEQTAPDGVGGTPVAVDADDDLAAADDRAPIRLAIAVAFPVLAAATMVGGIFSGIGARGYAGAAGVVGIGLALFAHRLKRPVAVNGVIVAGCFAIGVLMVVPSGVGNIVNVGSLASSAAKSGNVLRPPVGLSPGWQAIIGWLMGILGFVAAWVAIVVKRPTISLLLPLPIAAIAGISVPKDQQVASGIAVLALFAIGLGLLSSAQSVGEGDDRPPLAYEVRKALRSIPLIAAITVGLYFLAQAHILFPKPNIDPTQKPQKPKTVPLSEVKDRVLFEVESSISGPWRIGNLDVYDGTDWRLPPFGENKLKTVPRSGIVDKDLTQGVTAKFTVAGLGGAVLPGLPNTVGIVANGPRLAYDSRNGNIRVAQGQISAGLQYTVTAANLPNVDDLKTDTDPLPPDVKRFTVIPRMPPAVADLIDKAPKTSKWEEFDYLRTYILENVTSSGPGAPRAITPERVQDMISGSKEASPFEIVAAQAMLARWIGVPSRIGYGFDGGDQIEGKLQVRPRNGSTFVEVYFPRFKWLPVIGTPKKAKPSVGSDPSQQQFDPTIIPSQDISVQVFLPIVVPPGSVFAKQLRNILFVVVPLLLLILLVYILLPAGQKAFRRSRRKRAADAAGDRARIALAYAEWRDLATDFGYRHPTDTPLMFLDHVTEDHDHNELAWLVTRALWGDLQDQLTPTLASTAETLSRSLRRRLAAAHPSSVRAVALVSRLSLRDPYAPETDLSRKRESRRKGKGLVEAHA